MSAHVYPTRANALRRMKSLLAKYPTATWDIVEGEGGWRVQATLITPAARGLYDELVALDIAVVMEPESKVFPKPLLIAEAPGEVAEPPHSKDHWGRSGPSGSEPEDRVAESPGPPAAEPAKKKGVRPGTRAADLLAFLVATPGNFDEVNEAAVKAGKFPTAGEARDWSRYVLRQAGELVGEETYQLPGRAEPITITKKKGGRQLAA
jgi:hypothetical protein